MIHFKGCPALLDSKCDCGLTEAKERSALYVGRKIRADKNGSLRSKQIMNARYGSGVEGVTWRKSIDRWIVSHEGAYNRCFKVLEDAVKWKSKLNRRSE
mgnify:CR=1 FL=1